MNNPLVVLGLGVFIFLFASKGLPKAMQLFGKEKVAEVETVSALEMGSEEFLANVDRLSAVDLVNFADQMPNPMGRPVPEQVAWTNERMVIVDALNKKDESHAKREATLLELESLQLLKSVGKAGEVSFRSWMYRLEELANECKGSDDKDISAVANNILLLDKLQKHLDSSNEQDLEEYQKTFASLPDEIVNRTEVASTVIGSAVEMAKTDNFVSSGFKVLSQACMRYADSKNSQTRKFADDAYEFVFYGSDHLVQLRSRIMASDHVATEQTIQRLQFAFDKSELSLKECNHILSFSELFTNMQQFEPAKILIRKLLENVDKLPNKSDQVTVKTKANNAVKRINQFGEKVVSLDIEWVSDLKQFDLRRICPTVVVYWDENSALSRAKLSQLYKSNVKDDCLVIAVCILDEIDGSLERARESSRRMPKFLFASTTRSSRFFKQYPIEFVPTFVLLNQKKAICWTSSDIPGLEPQIMKLAGPK